MYIRLSDEYALRGFKGLPHVLVCPDETRADVLPPDAFQLLELCNGAVDMDMVLLTGSQRQLLEDALREGIVSAHPSPCPIDETQAHRMSRGAYIESVHWSITGGCNLKCKHCYMSAPHHKYADMTTEQCLDIIAQMEEANVASVTLTGGEPLLRKDFWQLVDALSQARIGISQLYTNGLLLDDAFLDAMASRGLSFTFVLSFDCVSCHDWMRGIEGTEERTIRAIRRLCEAGHSILIETALHSGNIDYLLPTYELLRDLGVSAWKTSFTFEAGEWSQHKTGTLSLESLYEHYFDLLDRYLADGQPMNLQLDGFFSGSREGGRSIPYVRNVEGRGGLDAHSCLTCRVHPYLLPDGRLLPCTSLTDSAVEQAMPSLLETTLADIYADENGDFFRTANIKARQIIEGNEECHDCRHKLECGGGCRACAVFSGNGILGVDATVCRFFREGYRDRVHALIHSPAAAGG